MSSHEVLRLWYRPEEGAPPVEVEALELVTGEGIVGDHTRGRMRHVTLVFADDWKAATDELGIDVDPAARRANVLVSGGGGQATLKQVARLGDALIVIKSETNPCPVMDKAAAGLMKALQPDARAGVWGRVKQGGALRIGAKLVIAEESSESKP